MAIWECLVGKIQPPENEPYAIHLPVAVNQKF